MPTLRLITLVTLAGFAVLGGPAGIAQAATRAHAKHQAHHACGEFRYWHEGRCVDAREKTSSPWSSDMPTRPVW